MEILQRASADIVIADIRMPEMDGFEVLREVKRVSPDTEVIMITAHGDVDGAIQAMRDGAFDFFTKPLKLRDLTASLQRTVRFQALRRENLRYRERLDRLDSESRRRYGLEAIIGESSALQEVKELIRQVCQTGATTVLICGETGTGKELVARAIHHESDRAAGAFVAVDCSAISSNLVESSFYGHEKGAFTDAWEAHEGYFEMADGGTLFLDEIGDMDLAMQTRLLRTLEERSVRRLGGTREIPVDVRVISATYRNLPQAIGNGLFREDLFYRLNTFTIRTPPLRECRKDILRLAECFLRQYAREVRKQIDGFAPEAAALFQTYSFPGNMRELRNMIERAAILCCTERIIPSDLEFQDYSLTTEEALVSEPSVSEVSSGALDLSRVRELNLEDIEMMVIREALRRCDDNQVHAAELLGISRFTLRRRLARVE